MTKFNTKSSFYLRGLADSFTATESASFSPSVTSTPTMTPSVTSSRTLSSSLSISESSSISLSSSKSISPSPSPTVTYTPLPAMFSEAQHFAVVQTPYYVKAGDFDKDGNIDILVANGATGVTTVTYLRGKGDGSFYEGSNISVGNAPYGIVIADFNKDGNLDFATTNQISNDVSVRLGDGAGNFPILTTYKVGSNPHGIEYADFDHDGNGDLIVTNVASNSLSLLPGKGGGAFENSTILNLGRGPYFICTGDYNNDGHDDIAYTNQNTGTFSVALGYGNNTFTVPVNYTVGSRPYGMVSTDINNDGKQDFLIVSNSSIPLYLFQGNANGTFGFKSTIAAGIEPVFGMLSEDFNGDGNPDLLTINYKWNSVTILSGDGSANFAGRLTYNVGLAPKWGTVADLNNDGRPDVVISNTESNSVSVLLNILTYSVSLTPSPSPSAPASSSPTTSLSPSASASSTPTTSPSPSAHPYPTTGYREDMQILFSSESVLAANLMLKPLTPGVVTAQRINTGNNYNVSTNVQLRDIGDFNGDKITDLVVAITSAMNNTGEIHLIYGTAYQPSVMVKLPLDSAHRGVDLRGSLSGDLFGFSVSSVNGFNKEPFTTIIVGAPGTDNNKGMVYVYYGNNFGFAKADNIFGFTISGFSSGSLTGYSVCNIGDIDNDGFTDIAVGAPGANGRSGLVAIVRGTDQTITSPLDLAHLSPDEGSLIMSANAGELFGSAIAAGKFNNDDFIDLVICAPGYNYNSGACYLLYGDNDSFKLVDILNGFQPYSKYIGTIFTGSNPGDLVGITVANLGNIDGDEAEEFGMGAPGYSYQSGAVYVITNPQAFKGVSYINVSEVNALNGFVIYSEIPGDALGTSLLGKVDINNDNIPEIISIAPGSNQLVGSTCIVNGKHTSPYPSLIDCQALSAVEGTIVTGASSTLTLDFLLETLELL